MFHSHTLILDSRRARLEGVISVPFVNGVAEFTRLRVDRNADQLTLSFTTVPSRFQAETSVDFSVVGFPDSVEKEQVSFLLFSDSIPPSVDWDVDEIGRQVANTLDVDPSRIQDMTLQLVCACTYCVCVCVCVCACIIYK